MVWVHAWDLQQSGSNAQALGDMAPDLTQTTETPQRKQQGYAAVHGKNVKIGKRNCVRVR